MDEGDDFNSVAE